MPGRIPAKPSDCSYCIAPDAYGMPAGPCPDHRGFDGQPIEYAGHDVYQLTDWAREVIGGRYSSGDWTGENGGRAIVYECTGYDPRQGFWMKRVDGGELKNVSERAIDRTFIRVRMTYGAQTLLEQMAHLGRMPTAEEASGISLAFATETLRRMGYLDDVNRLTLSGLAAVDKTTKAP